MCLTCGTRYTVPLLKRIQPPSWGATRLRPMLNSASNRPDRGGGAGGQGGGGSGQRLSGVPSQPHVPTHAHTNAPLNLPPPAPPPPPRPVPTRDHVAPRTYPCTCCAPYLPVYMLRTLSSRLSKWTVMPLRLESGPAGDRAEPGSTSASSSLPPPAAVSACSACVSTRGGGGGQGVSDP